ncbi:hypothetical protein SDC9_177000 [bioreactor metagenome]|uniref:Uncharacterized protein n=1 Tax=bioreactor metagenome TaxID=1076179 RepID=A0A645GRL1_9ZZZZ
MLLADVFRCQYPRVGGERVHRRIDAHRRNLTGEGGGGIQVGEGGGGGGVGIVIRRDIDRLDRSDGAFFG